MVYGVIFAAVAVIAIAATIRETAIDGYHRVPTRPELLVK